MRPSPLLAALLLAGPATPASAADLVWHVESQAGDVLESHLADEPINPASVLKIATTIWVLEELGPDHRFVTRFRATGPVSDGRLHGDLIVEGGGDPDFQFENAFLVAAALNRAGVERVEGRLRVGERFWIGWEGGSGGREAEPSARAAGMARRLRDALDPARWGRPERRAWEEFAARRGLDPSRPPAVPVAASGLAGSPSGTILVEHRSELLPVALRRFNCYSNNDIERFAEPLGGPAALEAWLRARLQASDGEVEVETASGLGTNRLTPRLVVRLLRELQRTCDRLGLRPAQLLPVAGCDPGTLDSFPRLESGAVATSVVAKTGTLTRTDGGVALLAGLARTVDGERLFCVAAPRAGGDLPAARHAEESFVLDLIAAGGGPHPRTCPRPLPLSDDGAQVTLP